MAEKRKSFFETPLMKSKIKSATVSLFPEAALGYLLGPICALLGNGVINIWLIQYWDKVLGLGTWAPLFETLLPIISAIVIVIGNLFVGRLMERKPTLAGKARPLILLGMPVIAIAMVVLFIVPLPQAADESTIIQALLTNSALPKDGMLLASILIAVGYNLFYAIAWPIYYTSHSALVNLSTRDGGARGLLGTAIMAAQLAAAGVSGMFGGILVDLLGLLPVYKYTDAYVNLHAAELGEGVTQTNDFNLVKNLLPNVDYTTEISRAQANQKWTILMIVMVATLVIGCLLEYFFTRERITEEAVNNAEAAAAAGESAPEVKKTSMADQIKVCVKDKYWWFIIIFFFLYQFGGQMKNNAMSFYSQSMTGGNSVASVINTVGAIPTALGMAIVWPIAAKLTKSKTIALGGVIAFVAAAVCYIPVFVSMNVAGTTAIAVASFCVKALGTAPAMYISIALMANVLDHQEAVHGIRTDGFTMAVYGAIMVAMAGVCNGIIVGLNSAFPTIGKMLNTTLAFGVEGVCYLLIAVMFVFMNVEKFSKIDNLAIVADQKAKVLAAGGEWIEPEVRAAQEAEENARLVEEARIDQLKKDCEKKHLDFDAENAKFLEKKAANDAKAAEKKAAADAKKAEKEAAIPEEVKAAKAAKEAEALEAARIDLNKVRVAAGLPEYVA